MAIKVPKSSCIACDRVVVGSAFVHADGLLHSSCVVRYENERAGRRYRCPKCKGRKVMDDPSRTKHEDRKLGPSETPLCAWDGCRGCAGCRDRTRRVEVPVEVPCDLCEGHGYTKTEAKPRVATSVVGWDL